MNAQVRSKLKSILEDCKEPEVSDQVKVKHDQYLIANVQVSEAAAPCSGPLQRYDVQFYLIIFPIMARGGPGRQEKGTAIDIVAYDQSM